MKEGKDGSARILSSRHFGMINPWDKPVVGWTPNSQGVGGLHNAQGHGLVRIVLHKGDGEEATPLYDQPVIVENPGAIVIAQLGDKIGLVRNFRMISERLLPDAGASYLRCLEDEQRWSELVESLGRWSWEAPRGLAPQSDSGEEMEAFILKVAKMEANEEGGFKVEDARIVGRVNVNSTFFTHSQYVVHAQIVSIGEAQPENLEILGGTQLFTMKQLKQMNMTDDFDDGLTLSAMALCGLSL